MELSTQQTQQVENYLEKKGFDFIDLKVEILDHMISDIESLINNNYSFENAFKITVLKWNKHFKETSSFYFGILYSESKIVVKKAVKIFKPFFFLYLAAYILPILITSNFAIQFSKSSINFFNGFLNGFTLSLLIYMIFIIVKMLKSKVKTTYSFILRTQYLGLIFLVIPLMMQNHFNTDGTLTPFLSGFHSAGFTISFICHHFYKKHIEEIKKYKIS